MAQSESNERKWILLLCLLAAIHVFIFSAAFPFFNNVDEQAHFDLVVKYSHGHIPRRLEPLSKESMQYIVVYGSPEFLWPPETFRTNSSAAAVDAAAGKNRARFCRRDEATWKKSPTPNPRSRRFTTRWPAFGGIWANGSALKADICFIGFVS